MFVGGLSVTSADAGKTGEFFLVVVNHRKTLLSETRQKETSVAAVASLFMSLASYLITD